MGRHGYPSDAVKRTARRDEVLDRLTWLGPFAVGGGYYLLCLSANDWQWMAAVIAWTVGVAGFGLLILVAMGIGHVMDNWAELEGDAWWHDAARWASGRWDSEGDDGDGDGG
jgi:hypothetical protein